MATEQADKPAALPDGYGTVTPWIVTRDTAQLLEFMRAAFDAEETVRFHNEDGSVGHAEAVIGNSVVMMFDARAEWTSTPALIRLYVEDGDATFRKAVEAGGVPMTEMTELAWGDRVGRVRDPLGNVWWIQCRLAELNPVQMTERAEDPKFQEAMRYMQESLDLTAQV
ncbi:VOC family protein [Streptomyces sp. NPDC060006]|uniref:VOC family protein n=1 Tax=unclassified Streptomyces TaxID=2593676 RepID=UPI0036A79832